MQCQICGLGVSDKKEVQYRYHVHCLIQQVEDIRSESLIAKTAAEKRAGKAEQEVRKMQDALVTARTQIHGLMRQLDEAQANTGRIDLQNPVFGGGYAAVNRPPRVSVARTPEPRVSPQGPAAKCKICTHQESSHLSSICAVCNKDCSKPPEPEKKVDRFSLIDLD